MRIEALIFDIGNVLVPFNWQPFTERLQAGPVTLTTEAEKKLRELAVRFEVGEITGEVFGRLATRAIEFQGDEREFAALWNSIFGSNPPMERTIQRLKEQFPLYLLSNTSEMHLTYLMQNCGVLRSFVDGVYSFRAKCAKPDPKIFEIAIRQFGIKPENTAYIDDLPANVRSASDLGFRSIQYDLTRHTEFEQRLAEFGIQIRPTRRGQSTIPDRPPE
jgi:epoxide hydrolase-like predicted phosphatase